MANFFAATGITRVLEACPRRNCLLVLNYHRVGNPQDCPFDPGVFSATAEDFDEQVRYLKARFSIATLAEVQEMVERPQHLRGFHVHISFDDGYRDNYDLVFPILRSHGATATFFLTTGFIGTESALWWDQIAYAVRHANIAEAEIEVGGRVHHLDLRSTPREIALQHVLRLYHQSNDRRDPARYAAEVIAACGMTIDNVPKIRLMMSWEEARELSKGGMDIASHTHSHPILSKLTPEQQEREMTLSRQILHERLGIVVDALAYPVGQQNSFTDQTKQALLRSGYRTAFSYYGGINLPETADPLDVRRTDVSPDVGMARLRLRSATAAALARAIPV